MVDLADICPLSDFQRNAKDHVKRLKETGRPEVLTINGHAELVVQSAAAYQALLDQTELARSVQVLRERIAAADAGKPGVPAEQVLAAVAERLGLAGRP